MSTAAKASKSPSKPYTLFAERWIECEKTKTPTTSKSRSGKSKKCKASKAADADTYTVTDATDETVAVLEPWLFDPPQAAVVRQHFDHVFIFSVAH